MTTDNIPHWVTSQAALVDVSAGAVSRRLVYMRNLGMEECTHMGPLLSGHVETETEEMESLENPTSPLEGSSKHCCKTSLHRSQAAAGQAKFVLLIKLPRQEHRADMGHGKGGETGASALSCQAGGKRHCPAVGARCGNPAWSTVPSTARVRVPQLACSDFKGHRWAPVGPQG